MPKPRPINLETLHPVYPQRSPCPLSEINLVSPQIDIPTSPLKSTFGVRLHEDTDHGEVPSPETQQTAAFLDNFIRHFPAGLGSRASSALSWGSYIGLHRDNNKEHENYYLGFRVYCRPVIFKPPLLDKRILHIKALKRNGGQESMVYIKATNITLI